MPVRRETRRGETRLVIDINYRRPDGTTGCYRKDAPVQTMTAARAEERRLLAQIAQHGEPHEPTTPPTNGTAPDSSPAAPPAAPSAPPPPAPATSTKTFADVVTEYRATFMVTDLKVTTRRGYASVLDSTLLPRFGALPLHKVDSTAAAELDLALSKRKRSQSTRNNTQIVLRGFVPEPVEI